MIMEFIKQWALGLVLISVVGTVVLVLSPSGSIEKQVRITVSLVIMIMTVNPLLKFFDIKKDFSFEKAVVTESPDIDGEKYLIDTFREDIQGRISNLLKDSEIEVIGTEIDISVNGNEVRIDRVKVNLAESSTERVTEVKDLIKNEYGIIAEVEVSG